MIADSENSQWDNLFKNQRSQSIEANEQKTPQGISSYIFIYDCFLNSIIFVNQAFRSLTGHEMEKFDLNFLLDIIHPDDRDYFFASEARGLDFTNQLSFDEHFRYTLTYSYRVKKANGEYVRIQQECQALEVNESGHLVKTLVTHKRKNEESLSDQSDYKIYDKLKNIYVNEENCYQLTKRELEIVNLIKEGHCSKKVSEILSLSKHTVLTHRRNILQKTNSSSFIELVKKLSYRHF